MKKCDHIVGIIEGFENEPCNLVFMSDKDNEFAWYAKHIDNPQDNGQSPINFFRFCPVCGQKVKDFCYYDDLGI